MFLTSSSGTPRELGVPFTDPEPAATRTVLWAPWNPPLSLTMPFFFVYPLASLTACMVASVPETAILHISAEGTVDVIFSRSLVSGWDGAPKTEPFLVWSLTAFATRGQECPTMRGP